MTLHSSETVPSLVKTARSASINSGPLYAFGTSTVINAKHELRPPKFSA